MEALVVTIPNPFRLVDDLFIDYIFNRVSWWSEYNFEKDAMHLRMYCIYAVVVPALFIMVLYNFGAFCLLLAMSSVHHVARSITRRTWIRTTKTGKNVSRLTDFSTRMFYSGSVLLQLFCATDSWLVLISLCIGGLSVIPAYFEVTDAMPPGYYRHKMAWNPL